MFKTMCECNRCGKWIEDKAYQINIKRHLLKGFQILPYEKEIHLCPECIEKFNIFMRGEENASNKQKIGPEGEKTET